MASNSLGLGKGLDALIRETSSTRDANSIQVLPIKDIEPNPNQPRRSFNDRALEDLSASIKSQGILQPLLVRPLGPAKPGKFEIVAGERRWRASQLAGLTEVPVMIKSLSSIDTLAAALIENLQREDLNPIEEANGLQVLKDEFGLSQEDLAKKIGKSRSAIANSLRLLTLPQSVRQDLLDGRLTAGHARSLLSISDASEQEKLRQRIIDERLSVRESEGLAARWKESVSANAEQLIGAEDNATQTMSEPVDASELDDGAFVVDDIAPKKNKPQSAIILDIQNTIHKALSVPVRVTGKEDKGRISITFTSKEELQSLLHRLAGNVLNSNANPILPASDNLAIASQTVQSISGNQSILIPGNALPKIQGATSTALTGNQCEAIEGSNISSLDSKQHVAIADVQRPFLEHQKVSSLGSSEVLPLSDSSNIEQESTGNPVDEADNFTQ